jgi:predicted SAM-dependent methyltransferase
MKRIIKRIPVLNSVARRLFKYIKAKRGSYRLKNLVKKGGPLKLVIGAEGKHDPGWIDTESEFLNLLNPEHWQTHFPKGSIDAMLAEHVWEHLTIDEGLLAAKLCFEYLKPGRHLRVAVPDGFHPSEEYINNVKPGGIGRSADDHKVLYNYVTFSAVFEKAGFRVNLLEHFDSDGGFHFVDWSPEDGRIKRSKRFDQRNKDGELHYTSLILDAWKDA